MNGVLFPDSNTSRNTSRMQDMTAESSNYA